MSEHTSLIFPHWGQILMEGSQAAQMENCNLRVEIARLRTKMTIAAMRLHGLAKLGQLSNGAVDEVAGYLDDSLNV